MTFSRLLALVLVTICGSAIAVGFYHAWSPPYVTAQAPPAQPAPAGPYTFPSVIHTPEETARARLVCEQAGDYGWGVAFKRQRTGLTLEEALALLTREHGRTADLRPLERVTTIVYWYDADTDGARPDKARERVQRVCLTDMLGSLADPKPEPAAPAQPPEKPRKGKSK
jgi:hypothetical protein